MIVTIELTVTNSLKKEVMASDGIACRILILIQNEQLEQVDTFPYLGSLITEDGECTNVACHCLNWYGIPS